MTLQRGRTMKLATFITAESAHITAEWAEFARTCVPAASQMNLEQRHDHIDGMLRAVSADLERPQTAQAQAEKSKGKDDGHLNGESAAKSHGTDRAATGFTPVEMVSEFRALRASVLRLWSQRQGAFTREDLVDVTRFNEAIDQLLAESIATYAHDVDRSKDLFLGVLGHDLRTPLGAIMMSASLMMKQYAASDAQVRTASRILKSGTRMDAMIRDLLDFTRSRLGSGIPVARTAVDLAALCRHTVEEIEAFYPSCSVHFEATGDLQGEWDGDRIAQVLSNLIGNAYQHGAEDAPLTVLVRGAADDVVLTVHNRGAMIAKSRLREIFDPFRQLKKSTGVKPKDLRSAGLGLYIAQAIVSAHDGVIEVTSVPSGTTFTVILPRSPRVAKPLRARKH